ncbi:hypothetical protein RIF29_21266 [Crotalaria pallida]|uniref:Uncharacterized protein n=1 Tax=Crotalaria pallida TaxID=3830 RepID=A0AAN9F504_CROPI
MRVAINSLLKKVSYLKNSVETLSISVAKKTIIKDKIAKLQVYYLLGMICSHYAFSPVPLLIFKERLPTCSCMKSYIVIVSYFLLAKVRIAQKQVAENIQHYDFS